MLGMSEKRVFRKSPCKSCEKKDTTGKGGCGGYGCMTFRVWFRDTWRTFQLHYLGYIPKPKPVEEVVEETEQEDEAE